MVARLGHGEVCQNAGVTDVMLRDEGSCAVAVSSLSASFSTVLNFSEQQRGKMFFQIQQERGFQTPGYKRHLFEGLYFYIHLRGQHSLSALFLSYSNTKTQTLKRDLKR